MNVQKLLIAIVVSTVFQFLLDYLWYGMIMMDNMTPMPNARTEPDMMWLILSYIIFSLAFVYIYTKGVEHDTKLNQGMKYGIWVTILTSVAMGFLWHGLTTSPPLSERLMDMGYSLVKYILLGILVAYATGLPGGTRGKGAGEGDG